MSIDVDKIQTNYELFDKLVSRIDGKVEPLNALMEHFGNRLAECPASVHKDYHNAFVGGLLDHSLRVLANAKKLVKTFSLENKIDNASLIFVSLFHDIGKLGSLTESFYLEQENKYQQEKGWMYEYNPECQFMTVPHRSIQLLQHFGVTMSEEEYLAILLSAETEQTDYKQYLMKEPPLAVIVQMADKLSCLQESKKI